MEYQERLRLKKLYEQYSEEALLEMLSEGRQAYQEGVYELILEEAKKRGLEEKIEEVEKNKIEKESLRPEENDLVTVHAGSLLEVQLLRSLLETEGIAVFLKDEILGTHAPAYAAAGGVGAIKVVIAKKDLDRAKLIVQEFLKEK